MNLGAERDFQRRETHLCGHLGGGKEVSRSRETDMRTDAPRPPALSGGFRGSRASCYQIRNEDLNLLTQGETRLGGQEPLSNILKPQRKNGLWAPGD